MNFPSPKTRPTEYWLAVWTAIVTIATGLGAELAAPVVAGVGTLIGLAVTFFASRADTWGPSE